ncbi:unnamed protein product [Protopolystoma xenopodis]|uniref:Uncharacterized protein n=1 Tax=Protopolystoma xenopodis TaxID=117903 RepID=A0A3S5AM56_9PLAT|nr:unnamed protein product [Protopolystoma xenopodis]
MYLGGERAGGGRFGVLRQWRRSSRNTRGPAYCLLVSLSSPAAPTGSWVLSEAQQDRLVRQTERPVPPSNFWPEAFQPRTRNTGHLLRTSNIGLPSNST